MMTLATEAANQGFYPAGQTMPAAAAFHVTVRGTAAFATYSARAASSSQAAIDAADLFGDAPCGITVTCA